MAVQRININGIDELRFNLTGTTVASMPRQGATQITNAGFNGVNPQTGTSYTVQSSDNEKLVTLNNGSAVAVTLPQPGTSGIDPNFVFWVANIGAGTVTITPTSSTIDGAATLTLAQYQGIAIFTDGTNYFTVRGAASGSGIVLETDGTPNGSQSLLNLEAGANVTLTDDGSGTVTIAASASLSNPMTATGDLIVGGTVSGGVAAPARLGAGSDGDVLTVVSGAPAWQPASAGGLVLLEAHSASSSATLDFTAWYSASYDDYVISLINVLPVTGGNYLRLLFSTDGGSTWDNSSSYEYALSWVYTGGTGLGSAATADTSIVIAGSNVGNSTQGVCGDLHLIDPGNTVLQKSLKNELLYFHDAVNENLYLMGGARYQNTAAVDGLRFFMQTGDIASGTIRVYGVAH